MTPTYAEPKAEKPKTETFDPAADPNNHAIATDEKDFGIRGVEDEDVVESADPATQISSRPLNRSGEK